MATVRCLNLGCGDNIIGHAVNVDIRQHRPEIDVVCDLNNLPWPWTDGSFDQIVARAIFEHLRLTLLEAMNEAWRLMAPAGFIEVKLPYFAAEMSYNAPDHRYQVGRGVFDIFDPSTPRGRQYPWYTDRKWTIRRLGLNQGGTSVYAVLDVIKARRPKARRGLDEADTVHRAKEADRPAGAPGVDGVDGGDLGAAGAGLQEQVAASDHGLQPVE